MKVQKLRQKLLLLCAICEKIPTSEASLYYNNIFSFYNSLRKYTLQSEAANWIENAVSLWEIRVHKIQESHSI